MTERTAPREVARALVLAIALGAGLGAGAAHADAAATEPSATPRTSSPFHCDGTDLSLFLERQEAGWIGYGETWDHDTCAEGAATIYAPGARQWADMRPKWSMAIRPQLNAELYATAFPIAAFSGIAGVVGIAWLVAFVQRRRRVRVATLSCPSCATEVPINLDDPALRNHFCPACGAPCVLVDDRARGRAEATAGAT